MVKETAAKPSENNTEKEAHVTEKLPQSEKNYVSDQNKGMQATISLQCDQCDFKSVSDKGLKQHTRIKHNVSQVDGNTTESEDECFKVLGASEKCAACNKCFETSHQCYEHMF